MTQQEKAIKLEIGQDHFDMIIHGLMCARKMLSEETAKEYAALIRVLFQIAEEQER